MFEAGDSCFNWAEEGVARVSKANEFSLDAILLCREFQCHMGGGVELGFLTCHWVKAGVL
jgi:hypothetical protein